jgi:transposase-like protein
MANDRKQHSAEFTFKVALKAAKETQTISQLASEQGLHPNQISRWKQQLLQEGKMVFADNRNEQARQAEQAHREAELYEQIGRLKMELEWLKKKVE